MVEPLEGNVVPDEDLRIISAEGRKVIVKPVIVKPALIVPHTLLSLDELPPIMRDFLETDGVSWALVRFYSITEHGGQRTDCFRFKKGFWVRLGDMPEVPLRVLDIPRFAQPAFKTVIWPDWKLPPRKIKWVDLTTLGETLH